MTMKKITAGRDVLGEFAPKFAQLNDDVLFGEVWSRESELSARDRSLITVTALMAQGLMDTSFGHHLQMAKENGITHSEIAEILTHAAFYADWPKAWAAFRMAKDIWADAENTDKDPTAFKGHVGDVSTVIRVALTGRTNTPDLHAILALLGQETAQARLNAALAHYKEEYHG